MKAIVTSTLVALMMFGSVQAQNTRGHETYNNRAENTVVTSRQNNNYYVAPANKDQVKQMVKVIKNASFDDKRLEIAKLCIMLRPMYAEDLKTIAKLFSFDSARLEFLEFAYDSCPNPQNYYKLENTFSFRSYYRELQSFIDKHYTSASHMKKQQGVITGGGRR